jgi:hypothetical protein
MPIRYPLPESCPYPTVLPEVPGDRWNYTRRPDEDRVIEHDGATAGHVSVITIAAADRTSAELRTLAVVEQHHHDLTGAVAEAVDQPFPMVWRVELTVPARH